MDSSLGSKILIGLVILCGLALAFVAGTAVSEENYFQLALILTLVFGLGYLTIAGPRYWIIVPFALFSGLPAIPLGGRSLELGELAIAACAVIFIANIALKHQRVVVYRPLHLPVLLFMIWVGIVWVFNPVGILIFGSQTVGGRFYFKLVLAFLAFLMMASTRPSEKDVTMVLLFLIAATALMTAFSIWSFQRGLAAGALVTAPGEDFYTWHQVLSAPAYVTAMLLFGRYKVSEVFSPKRFYLALLYIGCLALALNSGKRMGVMAVLITPVAAAFLHKEYRMVIWSLIGAGLFAVVVGLGHGQMFTFPKTVQRALSFLPAQWDDSFKDMQGGADIWREKIRERAWEMVVENPIMGRGYAMDLEELVGAAYATDTIKGGVDNLVASAVAGRSWHNTWLGYTADFGIPVTMAHAALWIVVLLCSLKVSRMVNIPVSYRAFAGFVFLYTFRDVIASHTSGHTANDAFNRWWMYGLLFAIYYAARALAPDKVNEQVAAGQIVGQALPAGALAMSMQRRENA